MGTLVRINNTLYDQARKQAHAERRSIAGQIEFWALVGCVALNNPDLPIAHIRDLVISRNEGRALTSGLVPEDKRSG